MQMMAMVLSYRNDLGDSYKSACQDSMISRIRRAGYAERFLGMVGGAGG